MPESEHAHPLHWPRKQPRTKPNARIYRAPFSVGEKYQEEQRVWREGQGYVVTGTKTKERSKAVSIAIAADRLDDQLQRLEAKTPILSTNLELRLNGAPRSGQKEPEDPGAAVYFTLKGKRLVFACDKWVRVADNIAALAAHIRAIRSVENFGVGTIEQAFAGYQALEDFSSGQIPWRRILGIPDDRLDMTLEMVEQKYRERAKEVHPDMTGNAQLQMAQLNIAITQARAELRPS